MDPTRLDQAMNISFANPKCQSSLLSSDHQDRPDTHWALNNHFSVGGYGHRLLKLQADRCLSPRSHATSAIEQGLTSIWKLIAGDF